MGLSFARGVARRAERVGFRAARFSLRNGWRGDQAQLLRATRAVRLHVESTALGDGLQIRRRTGGDEIARDHRAGRAHRRVDARGGTRTGLRRRQHGEPRDAAQRGRASPQGHPRRRHGGDREGRRGDSRGGARGHGKTHGARDAVRVSAHVSRVRLAGRARGRRGPGGHRCRVALRESGLSGAGARAPRTLVRARRDGHRGRRRSARGAIGEGRLGARRGGFVHFEIRGTRGARTDGREVRAQFHRGRRGQQKPRLVAAGVRPRDFSRRRDGGENLVPRVSEFG